MPAEKPDFPLSAAMERMFDYPAPRVQDNELYTTFKYTALEGFDYNGGDGTITRRDPSRPILVGGKYYMWYTKRDTKHLLSGSSLMKLQMKYLLPIGTFVIYGMLQALMV